MQVVHEVSCGLDVHKKSVTACVLRAGRSAAADAGARDLHARAVGVGRLAARLRGGQGIKINCGYSAAEPGANASFVVLGVAEVGKTTKLIEKASAARATNCLGTRSGPSRLRLPDTLVLQPCDSPDSDA